MASITVTGIPQELVKHILKVQGDIKVKKGVGVYSQSATIIQIINDHKKQDEEKSSNSSGSN